MDQGRMNRIQGVGHMPEQDMGVIQADHIALVAPGIKDLS